MLEREIDLLELWNAFKKHLIKIILITIIFGGISFGVNSFLITPEYKASTSMIIGKNNSQVYTMEEAMINMNDLKLSQELVDTYSEIIKTRGIADLVINNLGLDMDYEEFSKKVRVSSKNNTEIFEVSVVDNIPTRARDIANETSDVFKEAVKKIMRIDNVQILDAAIEPTKPVSPNILRNTALGSVLGFMFAAFIFLLKEVMDTAVKTPEDISETFNIPVIGIIPDRKRG